MKKDFLVNRDFLENLCLQREALKGLPIDFKTWTIVDHKLTEVINTFDQLTIPDEFK